MLRRRLLVAGLLLLLLGAALTVVVGTSAAAAAAWTTVPRVDGVAAVAPLVTVSKALSLGLQHRGAVAGTGVVTLVIAVRRRWLALGAWVTAVLLSELAIGPVKALVDRPRPPGALIETSAASYPSGHAIASAVTLIGVVMALTTGRRRLHWMVGAV